ncbi:MAG: 4-hydroxy-tetrahydrodipicolinate reductase [Lachnospiraceae bacterium]|nr:4-hydroxy-tetrahydrodipicolinate reductase [Lachnospiraceae bacterium]
MTRVILHGCNGRMGRVITGMIAAEPEMKIVAGIDPFQGVVNEYPVYKAAADCEIAADVIIDFASAAAVDGLLAFAVEKQIPVVLCTTGLSEEQLAKVKEASQKVAILRSANMSLGVNLLMELVKQAAAVLYDAGFDIEIVEKHHNQKLDAPSGTAIALGEAAKAGASDELHNVYDRSQVRQKREHTEIGFSAVRGGTITGEHDVIFAGTDEVVTLSHTAYSRAVFAKGAVQAAKYLAGKPAGLYQMKDVVGL